LSETVAAVRVGTSANRTVIESAGVPLNVTGYSVSLPDGWRSTETRDVVQYVYRVDESSQVLVSIRARDDEWQLRASTVDEDALITRNDFLVGSYASLERATSQTGRFLTLLTTDLETGSDVPLSRTVQDRIVSFSKPSFLRSLF